MAGIDESKPFVPINIGVLTVTDSRTLETDTSGKILADRLTEAGHTLAERKIVKDEVPAIVEQLNAWADDVDVDVVITNGGTGLTGRDVTPEAFDQVCEKEIPGFGELFRWVSLKSIGTSTVQSRATLVLPAVLIYSHSQVPMERSKMVGMKS
jgi:molybdenum cofactor biosynthesis protein B